VAGGYVVEDVYLRADLGVVGDQFYLSDISHAVKLQSYLLRVGAETAALPAFGGGEQQRRYGMFLLFRTAGDYLELELPTHYYYLCSTVL
jgi:hypothetical protein